MKDVSDMNLNEARAEIERVSALLDEMSERGDIDESEEAYQAVHQRYDSAVRRVAALEGR